MSVQLSGAPLATVELRVDGPLLGPAGPPQDVVARGIDWVWALPCWDEWCDAVAAPGRRRPTARSVKVQAFDRRARRRISNAPLDASSLVNVQELDTSKDLSQLTLTAVRELAGPERRFVEYAASAVWATDRRTGLYVDGWGGVGLHIRAPLSSDVFAANFADP
jgi:hypothetical protein